jgi:hypothetical protein
MRRVPAVVVGLVIVALTASIAQAAEQRALPDHGG